MSGMQILSLRSPSLSVLYASSFQRQIAVLQSELDSAKSNQSLEVERLQDLISREKNNADRLRELLEAVGILLGFHSLRLQCAQHLVCCWGRGSCVVKILSFSLSC